MREEEMDCREICELLTAYLDGEVTPEEKAYIETHLPGCPQCRAELEALSATQANLRGVFQVIANEAVPSPQLWGKIKDRLETGESRRGFWSSFTLGRVATASTAVVVLVIAVVIWQFGGFFGMSSPPPAPTTTPAPEITIPVPTAPTAPTVPPIEIPQAPPPVINIPPPSALTPLPTPTPSPAPSPTPPPMPAPPPPFEVSVVPEEAYYLPGEIVEVKLSLSNVSSEFITVEPYPTEVQVTSTPEKVWYVTSGSGRASVVLTPGHERGLVFTWDQKDQKDNQVPPGWYNITFKDINVIQRDSRYGINPTARILIQYPQGAMEKSLDINQSQEVNDITVTLERVELSSTGMTVYAFNTPPGYTSPQGILPTSTFMVASAEYIVDGGAIKQAGLAGFRFLEEGTRFTWKNLDPVPADAKELTFRIIMRWEDKPDELLGPWEFKIPLE